MPFLNYHDNVINNLRITGWTTVTRNHNRLNNNPFNVHAAMKFPIYRGRLHMLRQMIKNNMLHPSKHAELHEIEGALCCVYYYMDDGYFSQKIDPTVNPDWSLLLDMALQHPVD